MTIWTPYKAYIYAYEKGLTFPKDAMITTHFSWNEVFKNEKGDCPCIWIFYNLLKVFREIEKLRILLKLPIIINRAYSSVQHNKDAGSVAELSCHILGLAIDFYVTGMTVDQVINILLSRKDIKVRIEKGTKTYIHIDVGNPYTAGGMNLGLFNR